MSPEKRSKSFGTFEKQAPASKYPKGDGMPFIPPCTKIRRRYVLQVPIINFLFGDELQMQLSHIHASNKISSTTSLPNCY